MQSDDKGQINEDKDSASVAYANGKFVDIFEIFFKQLTELNKISTVGPFISMINDPQINVNNMREYGNVLINYQRYLNKYLNQMINSYFQALEKVSAGIDGKNSHETRMLIINSFEEVFSNMFESTDFSVNYNNLINIYIDLNKSYQKFFDASLPYMSRQSLSKEEKDLLFKDLYEIKKITLEIKNWMKEKKNE